MEPGQGAVRNVAQDTAGNRLIDGGAITRPLTRAGASPGLWSSGDALKVDDARRTRLYAFFAVALGLMAAVILQVVGGDPLARKVHLAGLGVAIVGCLWIAWMCTDVSRYRPWLLEAFGYLCVFAVDSGFYFWGGLSSAVQVVPVGVLAFAMGQSFRAALMVLLACLVPHAILEGLTAFEVIENRALIRVHGSSMVASLLTLLMSQFVIVAAFALGRWLRRARQETLQELEMAVREAAQREALLREARADLADAAHAGGPGPYSSRVFGSYRLGEIIGRGAMGDVYEAFHEETDEAAAVKVVGEHARRDAVMLQRFLREQRITQALEVDNVVRVLDVADSEATIPYLVMERLYGETLAGVLRETPRMSPSATAEMLTAVGRGLAAAHEAGIVHRDLKPGNLFCHRPPDGRPVWKILDFGIARLRDDDGSLTRGVVVGTPGYMAPEQAQGHPIDHRCDIYALGAIAYRALTGRPAFVGQDIPAILYQVVHGMPPRPSEISDLGEAFDLVLAIALAKDPGARFQHPAALARAVEAAAAGEIDGPLRAQALAVLARQPWGGHRSGTR